MEKQGKEWDAFVSHALEDQESFVRHLSRMLTRLGLSVWYADSPAFCRLFMTQPNSAGVLRESTTN